MLLSGNTGHEIWKNQWANLRAIEFLPFMANSVRGHLTVNHWLGVTPKTWERAQVHDRFVYFSTQKYVWFYMICLHIDLFNISRQSMNDLSLVMVELVANSMQIECLLDMARPLHSWNHGNCGCLLKISPVSIPRWVMRGVGCPNPPWVAIGSHWLLGGRVSDFSMLVELLVSYSCSSK